MIDSNLALVTYLQQSNVISAMVANQAPTSSVTTDTLIFCGMLPQGYKPEVNGRAITFATRSGSADPELPIIRPSVQIECWAEALDSQGARELYRAVFDQLHQQNNIDLGATGYILSIVEEVQGQDLVDPDTQWASVLSYYRLVMRSQ